MSKQSIGSVAVLFVLSLLLGFLVHGLLLSADYGRLGSFMRGDAVGSHQILAQLAAHLLIAIGLTALYRQGCEAGKGWAGQGLRFGLIFAIAATVPTYLIYYAVQPWPAALVGKQIVCDTFALVMLGVVTAALNRPTAAPATAEAL
ncbi:MAG: hypothetical protein ACHQ4G_08440 [Opitutales bacterium]